MSAVYVVGLSCTTVQEVTEPRKQLLYSFEITWSDDSITQKDVSSEDLSAFRNNLKTEVYKNKPEVIIPEVPDGKIGGFVSKAKKAAKRQKNINELCTQIVNLPHVQGKLQAIASQFESSPTDVVNTGPHSPTEDSPNRKSKTTPVPNFYSEAGTGNGLLHMAREAQPEPEVESDDATPESDYAEVVPDGRTVMLRIPPRSNSKLQYVEIEIIERRKRQASATRETSAPVYAEVVMLKSSLSNSDWLKRSLDTEDPDDPDEVIRSPPSVPPRFSVTHKNEVKDSPPSPDETEVSEKAEVHAPELADEMTDSAESALVRPPTLDAADPKGEKAFRGIFDAAMMSNFPSRTLIPLPPNHIPKKCSNSSDVKLSKNDLPSPDVPNICIVAVAGCKSSGENSLPFKRNQRAHLLYTTDVWWFISTGDSIGWVPADFWRIVTNSKTVSGKAMAPFAPWNFGVLSRPDCEALLLKNGKELDFLVRESVNSTGYLVLSVKKDETVHHFGIHVTETGLCCIGQHYFQTLHNVVLYYMKHALFSDKNGIGCQLGRLLVRPKK